MTDQMDLFGDRQAHARHTDPETSHAAAASITPEKLSKLRQIVYDTVSEFGRVTDTDLVMIICERHRYSPSGIRTRRSELVSLGLVRDSGEREQLDSGRMAILWEVTDLTTEVE